MGNGPVVMVVGDHSDNLSRMVTDSLKSRNVPVKFIEPGKLASLPVLLKDDLFVVQEQLVRGILFRTSPDARFSHDYMPLDQAFCDAETKALWLAALNLGSVLAINQYDAVAWFEGTGWPTWRRRFLEAGLPVSPFFFGGSDQANSRKWHLYSSCETRDPPHSRVQQLLGSAIACSVQANSALILDGEVVQGNLPEAITEAPALLGEFGVSLAQLMTDESGYIKAVSTFPLPCEKLILKKLAHRISELFYDYLHCW